MGKAGLGSALVLTWREVNLQLLFVEGQVLGKSGNHVNRWDAWEQVSALGWGDGERPTHLKVQAAHIPVQARLAGQVLVVGYHHHAIPCQLAIELQEVSSLCQGAVREMVVGPSTQC